MSRSQGIASGKVRLMAHLVAGYPDAAGCRAAARGLVEGGAAYLEVQLPFSDPSADGPAIQAACTASLAGGTRSADAFELIADLRRAYPQIPVFAMAYASLAVTPGIGSFVGSAAEAGAVGLIVPDLPFDDDEGLADACAALGAVDSGQAAGSGGGRVSVVPVAAPSMRPGRLAAMAALGRPYLYAALRAGITGSGTEIGKDTERFLEACASGGSRVLGGFGIRTGAQARAVAGYAHAVVAGTVFVEAIGGAITASAGSGGAARDEAIRIAVRAAAESIVGG